MKCGLLRALSKNSESHVHTPLADLSSRKISWICYYGSCDPPMKCRTIASKNKGFARRHKKTGRKNKTKKCFFIKEPPLHARTHLPFSESPRGWRRTRMRSNRGEEAHNRIRKDLGLRAPHEKRKLTQRTSCYVNLLSRPRTSTVWCWCTFKNSLRPVGLTEPLTSHPLTPATEQLPTMLLAPSLSPALLRDATKQRWIRQWLPGAQKYAGMY